MTLNHARGLIVGLAVLALGPRETLQAQIDAGNWIKQSPESKAGSMTLTVGACCNGGRRLTYHIGSGENKTILTVES